MHEKKEQLLAGYFSELSGKLKNASGLFCKMLYCTEQTAIKIADRVEAGVQQEFEAGWEKILRAKACEVKNDID